MDYLPITLNLVGKTCLVVGGGQVALRKTKALLKAKGEVKLVAPEVLPEISDLVRNNSLDIFKKRFTDDDLEGVDLIIAATNDLEVNAYISQLAQSKNIWVNVVDELEHCSFITPAIIDRSPLLIAISTGGIAPVLARKIREKIEWILPHNLGVLLNNLVGFREKIKARYQSFSTKRSFYEWFVEKSIDSQINENETFSTLAQSYESNEKQIGKVYLVGAGPGDPDLLTIKALKILQKADVVLHDSLVSKDILELVRRDAEFISVGKRARKHSVQQAEINQLLVEHAQKGLKVVRLKGGDPFIFGRGAEELEHIIQEGIDFEVIPGITSASGCSTYAGIPLTHRDHSQTVMFITAHCKDSKDCLDWTSIAKHQQTLAVYMGLMRNEILRDKLIEYGRLPTTPVALIENGTRVNQRVVIGTLAELPNMVLEHQVVSPSLIVIGEVVSLATELAWFNGGKHIIHSPKSNAKTGSQPELIAA